MATRGPYRRHSPQFKIHICSDIRSGKLGRREALKTHNLSANLMQMWLGQFDRGELDQEDAAATTVAEYEAHIAALEKKVGQLTMELDLLKKNTTTTTRQQQRELIDHQRPQGCSIRRGCQMMDLPRSTYYYQPKLAILALGDTELARLIEDIHDVFPGYGYRRITLELRARGHVVNHKRVVRIMRERQVYGHHRRRFKPVAGSEADVAVFPNHYRNIIPAKPDRVWVADITYIRVASGFIYLAVVLDACSRKVIGYALSGRIDTPLALAALTAAYRIRKPAPGTCIHHTDRGCQYASALYRNALEEFGLIRSMSAPANPYHNAQAESFMKTLKVEEVYLAGYEKFGDVATRLPYFIEEIYNERRMHSALGYQSPNHFEAQLARQAA